MQASSVEMKLMMCINHTFPETLYPKEQRQEQTGRSHPSAFTETLVSHVSFGGKMPNFIKGQHLLPIRTWLHQMDKNKCKMQPFINIISLICYLLIH